MFIDSTQTQNTQPKFSGIFALDGIESGREEIINDEKITSETIAERIARAEFLENGYINQVVEFTTDFTDLKINDIISIYAPTYRIPKELNKDRFIVQKVNHIFQDGFLKTIIRALRYDL